MAHLGSLDGHPQGQLQRLPAFQEAEPTMLPNFRWNGRATSAVPSLAIVLARRSPKR